MKYLKKITLTICLALLSNLSYAMEDQLDNLIQALEELDTEISGEERSKEVETYYKCSPDGTNCKRISRKKGNHILECKEKRKKYNVRGCHRNKCRWLKAGEIPKGHGHGRKGHRGRRHLKPGEVRKPHAHHGKCGRGARRKK